MNLGLKSLTLIAGLAAFAANMIGCSENPTASKNMEHGDTGDTPSALLSAAESLDKDQAILVIFDENGEELERRVIKNLNGYQPEKEGLAKVSRTGYHYYITPALTPDRNSTGKGALGFTAAHNNTDIYANGEWMGRISSGNTMYIATNTFLPGTQIRTSNEVQGFVWTDSQDYTRGFTLLPERQWGTYYRVPRVTGNSNDSRVYATVAALDYGHVQVGDTQYWMSPGLAIVVNVNQGAGISSEIPVFCTSWIDSHRYCRGATLDPID